MSFKKILLAALVASAISSVQAATYSYSFAGGTVSDTEIFSVGSGYVGTYSFNYSWSDLLFSDKQGAGGGTYKAAYDAESLSFSLTGPSGYSTQTVSVTDPSTAISGNGSYTFSNLVSGQYTLTISGVWKPQTNTANIQDTNSDGAPGFFAPTVSLGSGTLTTVAAPVSEPETYAMLLAGLGVMGAVARRRKKQA